MGYLSGLLLTIALMFSTGSPPATVAENPLAGTRWTLVSFDEKGAESPVVAGKTITLEFKQEDRAGGNGGCNIYGGDYQVQGGQLTIGPIMSTKRACTDEAAMEQENRFFRALGAASGFELSQDRLRITDDAGRYLLTFAKA